MTDANIKEIADLARDVRLQVLQTIKNAGMGHIGGDFSVTDILATLFSAVLKVDPKNPNKEDRDRLILSKGHAAVSLYSVLALCSINWSDPILLDQFPFREDPVRALTRSIEIIKYLEEVCDRIDINELNQARNAQDALAAQATIWDALMKEKRFTR